MNRLAELRAEAAMSRAAFRETLRELQSRLEAPFILEHALDALDPRQRMLRQTASTLAKRPMIVAALLAATLWLANRTVSRGKRGAKHRNRTNQERKRS